MFNDAQFADAVLSTSPGSPERIELLLDRAQAHRERRAVPTDVRLIHLLEEIEYAEEAVKDMNDFFAREDVAAIERVAMPGVRDFLKSAFAATRISAAALREQHNEKVAAMAEGVLALTEGHRAAVPGEVVFAAV